MLILHYLIYLNKGTWAGFQSLHALSNPPLFYFHFNKADFIYLQLISSLDLSCLAWCSLCCSLWVSFTQDGLCAFSSSLWLNPGSADTSSLECRGLGPGVLWASRAQAGTTRLVWDSIMVSESIPDHTPCIYFCTSDCRQVGWQL